MSNLPYQSKFTGQQIDDGIENAVRVTEQSLTSSQKQQARTNIGVTDEVLVAIVTANSAPTSSTLTYTATDGTTKNFKVGDEIRVPDQTAESGYVFYKLYKLETVSDVTTATWVKLDSGLEIVAASGTTLTAEVGKYYRYDNEVSTLAVTLPTITGATEVQEFKMYFKTASSNVSVTFTGGTIIKLGNYYIIPNSKYCVDCIWNGEAWTIQANEPKPYDSEIQYLQSSGTQYIDTGIKVSRVVDGKVVGSIDSNINNSDALVGGRNNNSTEGRFLWASLSSSSTSIRMVYGDNNNSTSYTLGTKVTTEKIGTTMYFNGTSFLTFNASDLNVTSQNNIYLFSSSGYDTPTQWASAGKIYSCQLIENGVLVRDFIPVRIGQTGYMYDKVSKTLFSNNGTGSFILGPDV